MNFNALDLNLMRVFDALMRERSVTRAGDRIGLSQPAVSAALSRLRHVFNDNLFVRQGNEMLPTPQALELGERARLALAEIEGMIRSVRGLELTELDRTYTLLGADFFSMLLMPQLARKVHEQAPNVRLRLLDSARGDVARLLQENAVDMALERPLELPDWLSSAAVSIAFRYHRLAKQRGNCNDRGRRTNSARSLFPLAPRDTIHRWNAFRHGGRGSPVARTSS